MTTIKLLLRRDASSVVVAVALALIGAGVITALSSSLASALTGSAPSFENGYLMPLLVFGFQLLILEASLRAIIFVRGTYIRSK